MLRKCNALKTKCSSLIKGGSIPKETKKAEVKKPKAENLGPKPIQTPAPVRVSAVSSVRSQSTARLKKKPTSVSVQKILSGEPITPVPPSVPPKAAPVELPDSSRGSSSYLAALTATSSVPMYSAYPPTDPNFLPFRYVANDYIEDTVIGGKRKREGSGKSVRWADCTDSGQLVETRLFVPQEEEYPMESEEAVILASEELMGEEEEDPQPGLHIVETERDLNKERLYLLSHKKQRDIATTMAWSAPRSLHLDASEVRRPPSVDSKEFRTQTLRLSKLEALLASHGAGGAKKTHLTSAITDPEDPPKEVFDGRRISAVKEYVKHLILKSDQLNLHDSRDILLVPWFDVSQNEAAITEDSSDMMELISLLPEYVRAMEPRHLEMLVEALMREENMHLMGNLESDEFRMLVQQIQYYGDGMSY